MKSYADSDICSITNSNSTGHAHINVTGARLCNQFCRRKPVIITYPECVFVALGTRREMRMRHFVMWPVPLCSIYPHYLKKGLVLGGGGEKLLNIK